MSKKLMTKLSTGAALGTAPLLGGVGSALAVAVGVAAMVGATTLHKRRLARARSGSGSNGAKTNCAVPSQVFVGLLRVHVPRSWEDLVRNDVLLDKTISEVKDKLIIYVVGSDKHEIVNYTSELYNLAWDVACVKNKLDLDIRIVGDVPGEHSPSWDELLLLPELNAVFGEEESIDLQHMNAKRFERDGLFAVTYHPLKRYATKYLNKDWVYFEDEHAHKALQDMVLLGGTFDHLHNGHKKLLSLAASICSRRLIIGITSAEMLRKKKHADLIESLETRQRNVQSYVSFIKPTLQVEFAVLQDPFGPAVVVSSPAAIVVSTETVLAVLEIDAERRRKNLGMLTTYVCRRTDASTLSSSYIREQLAAKRSNGLA